MKVTLWYSVLFIYEWNKNILHHFPLYILAFFKLPIIFHTKDHLELSIIQISFVSPWTKLLFKAKGSERCNPMRCKVMEIKYCNSALKSKFSSICLQYNLVFYNSIWIFISNLRHGWEFGCNSEALLDRGARPLIDFNTFRNLYNLLICKHWRNGDRKVLTSMSNKAL